MPPAPPAPACPGRRAPALPWDPLPALTGLSHAGGPSAPATAVALPALLAGTAAAGLQRPPLLPPAYFSLSPSHFDIRSEDDTEKKVELFASVATALAK